MCFLFPVKCQFWKNKLSVGQRRYATVSGHYKKFVILMYTQMPTMNPFSSDVFKVQLTLAYTSEAYTFLILLKLLSFAVHFNQIRSSLSLCLFSFHFVSLGILICLSKHFLPQIFISYQSSLFNLKSEHGALNCITCMARITPALIGTLRRDARSILLTHARMRSLHSALLEEEKKKRGN